MLAIPKPFVAAGLGAAPWKSPVPWIVLKVTVLLAATGLPNWSVTRTTSGRASGTATAPVWLFPETIAI